MSPLRRLTGPEIKALRDALISSFAGPNDLEDLLLYGLDENLDRIIDPGPLTARVRDVIQWTESRDRTDELVAAALDAAPKSRELRAVAAVLHADDGAGQFERVIRQRLGFIDTAVFLDGLVQSMNAVCRVEIDDEGIGTGFLVGPSLVITNHHVIFDDSETAVSADRLAFHFDYKLLEGKQTKGVLHRPDGNGTIVHDSAKSELDFALIRLAAKAGEDTVGGLPNAPVRGWLTPTSRPMVNNDPLMIIQHPKAAPQKFAVGTVIEAPGTPPNRVRYNVNTDEGSSGSPCFASDWAPVALHHWGGADHNRGVVFSAILAHLQAKGIALGS